MSLLDTKLANNIEIALAHIRAGPDEIATSLRTGDASRLSLDELSAVLAILPNDETLAMIRAFDGDPSTLGRPERFFIAVANVPHYTARAKAMHFRASFADRATEMRQARRPRTLGCRIPRHPTARAPPSPPPAGSAPCSPTSRSYLLLLLHYE